MIIEKETIKQFDKNYRRAFVNSLAGFRQAVLVGTQSAAGNANLAIFNSLIHLGADPALFGLISRPDVVPRDTLENIVATKTYTLNFIGAEHYKKAHQTSARYAKEVSEFEKVGLTAQYHASWAAPFVAEAEIKIAMQYEQSIPIPLNGTILIIGSITQVDISEEFIGADGFVNMSAADILISQGLDAYFVTKPIGRLAYAKP
jgi:flavin reductase (DIM6/NTAB) family NADH-FMN oxidoreductase RutF